MTDTVDHILRSTAIGGVERQAQGIASVLHQRGRTQALVILAEGGALPEASRAWHAERMPVEVFNDRRGQWAGLDRLWRLRAFLRRHPAQIVHLHYALPDSIIWNDVWAAKLAGKRVAVTLHHTLCWTASNTLVQRIKQWIARRAVDRFIATTEHARAVLGERIAPSRVRLIPCGVETPAPLARSAARARLGEWIASQKGSRP